MRHLLVLGVVLALLGSLYFFVQGGATSVHGRVLLQDVDGGEQPGSGAGIAWQPSAVVEQHLHAWLEVREKWQRENELEIRAARNEWSQKVSARDEAARILRVADIFQAMVQDRPYRQGLKGPALRDFMQGLLDAGRIDPDVGKVLLAHLEEMAAVARLEEPPVP